MWRSIWSDLHCPKKYLEVRLKTAPVMVGAMQRVTSGYGARYICQKALYCTYILYIYTVHIYCTYILYICILYIYTVHIYCTYILYIYCILYICILYIYTVHMYILYIYIYCCIRSNRDRLSWKALIKIIFGTVSLRLFLGQCRFNHSYKNKKECASKTTDNITGWTMREHGEAREAELLCWLLCLAGRGREAGPLLAWPQPAFQHFWHAHIHRDENSPSQEKNGDGGGNWGAIHS